MRYELTRHARVVLEARGIALAWMEQTLNDPHWIEPDPTDLNVQRYFRSIPEFGGRVLRVVVNTTVEPAKVVSIFFDRSRKGQP